MRVRGGIVGGLAFAVALSGCVGGVAPPADRPSAGRPPIAGTGDPRPKPGRVHPVRDAGNSENIRGIQNPARIVGAVPILPVPIAPPFAPADRAVAAGVVAGPDIASLPISELQAEAARVAFLTSCPGLQRRTDQSGLTRGADWQPACTAAASVPRGGARTFFTQWFEAVQVGDGKAFATGYYEPEIAGSLDRRDGYAPVYGRPRDLIDVDLGAFST